jgi:uncharacterized protein (TIGR03083 family)
MSSPSYAELVTAIRREGEGIHTAASLGCDPDVPPCEGWTMKDLVDHVARIYLYVAHMVSNRLTEPPDSRPDLPDGDTVEVFADALDAVVAALQEADAATPVWNWSDVSANEALFWARRMAHETSVHRFDAQTAHGVMQPIDAELAGDGMDEMIDVLAPRIYTRDDIDNGPTGTITLQSADGGVWHISLEPSGLTRLEVLAEPDVTVHGTTSALLLASYSRMPWTSLEVTGDTELLTAWTKAMHF